MNLDNAQQAVDQWIKNHGVRYFDELTNMAQLTEEVGEVARIIARRYGEQSEKESDKEKTLRSKLFNILVTRFSPLHRQKPSFCRTQVT